MPWKSIRFTSGATSRWGSCSGAASAGSACRPPGRRCPPTGRSSRARAVLLQRPAAAARPRGRSERHLLAQRGAREPCRLRESAENNPTSAQRQVRHHLDGDASRPRSNPDFSQVESDAYQVEVNQRYPVFYARSGPSSWRAWAPSSWPAPAATPTCAPPCTRAASSIPRGEARPGLARPRHLRRARGLRPGAWTRPRRGSRDRGAASRSRLGSAASALCTSSRCRLSEAVSNGDSH